VGFREIPIGPFALIGDDSIGRGIVDTLAGSRSPAVLMAGVTFALLFAWPFLEARWTGDHDNHHLLDRPRDRPMRTALGVATLMLPAPWPPPTTMSLIAHLPTVPSRDDGIHRWALRGAGNTHPLDNYTRGSGTTYGSSAYEGSGRSTRRRYW